MDAMKRGLQQMESGMVPEAAAMDAAVVLETAVDGCHNEGWSCIRWKLKCSWQIMGAAMPVEHGI